MPPPQQAQRARKSVHCGVGEGSPRPHPSRPQKTGDGPQPPAPKTAGWGRKSAQQRTPLSEAPAPPPPRAPWHHPHSVHCQLARTCSGQTGSGPWPPTPRTGGWGRVSARPRTLLREAGGAPLSRVPVCGPHSPQSQLARACTLALVTSSHAHTPRTHGKHAAGPGSLPQGQAVAGGRVRNPRHPSRSNEAPPSGRPGAALTARKASWQERALLVW